MDSWGIVSVSWAGCEVRGKGSGATEVESKKVVLRKLLAIQMGLIRPPHYNSFREQVSHFHFVPSWSMFTIVTLLMNRHSGVTLTTTMLQKSVTMTSGMIRSRTRFLVSVVVQSGSYFIL